MATQSEPNSSNQQLRREVRISRDNLQDVNEINDQTFSVTYALSQQISHGDILIEEIVIRRPKLKHQKRLTLLKDSEQASKLIEFTTDMPTHLIDEIDLADVLTINKIILKMLGKSQEI